MAVMFSDGIEIRRVSTAPYNNNCYVLVCRESKESVIIDAPSEPERVLAEAATSKVVAIVTTHCHMDHVLGLVELQRATGAPVAVHPAEADRLPLRSEKELVHHGSFRFGTIALKTIHVPGHTPGGIAFLYEKHLFSGDSLFPNGPGKTQSPRDFRQLVKNLQERIFTLPDDVLVYPGHGESTVLGAEKEQFRVFSHRPHRPDLCGDVLWLKD